MSVINTNVSATIASNALLRNDRAMGTAMEASLHRAAY